MSLLFTAVLVEPPSLALAAGDRFLRLVGDLSEVDDLRGGSFLRVFRSRSVIGLLLPRLVGSLGLFYGLGIRLFVARVVVVGDEAAPDCAG
jgi:hypothetical protein